MRCQRTLLVLRPKADPSRVLLSAQFGHIPGEIVFPFIALRSTHQCFVWLGVGALAMHQATKQQPTKLYCRICFGNNTNGTNEQNNIRYIGLFVEFVINFYPYG